MRGRLTRVMALGLGLALTLTACAPGGTAETTRPSPVRVDPRPWATEGRHLLVQFDSCQPFLDYVISHAVDLVGPYGLLNYGHGWWGGAFLDAPMALAAEDGAARAPSPAFSGTNVQVLGVDEPDIVKTDGSRIVALTEGRLIVVDVTGQEPEVVSRLNLGNLNVSNLFLSGDTVLMFGSTWGGPIHLPFVDTDADIAPVFQTPTVRIVEVDISGDAEVVRTMTVDGQFISGRMVGDSVRLVLSSSPVGFQWSLPEGSGLKAESDAIERNRQIIRNSSADNWIPYYLVTDAGGEVVEEGTLFDCSRASHPEEFSGLNMLNVVTIDISSGLSVTDAMGVLANGDTVYSSHENLYVATQNWDTWQWSVGADDGDEPNSVTTDIHKFDISDPEAAQYLATGRVEGYLLNQFAMDEHEGLLRVASTSQPAWWGDRSDSQSMISVLAQDGGELNQIGFVDGLGKTEQIYSVRFMGDLAYVVTFRQTDPLYTVDLSNPAQPEVVGELKILGYSAYLHPISGELLLGVGQDATEEGRIQGTQISVFDVSKPGNPQLVDKLVMSKGSHSEAEYDHHAFLYWEPTGLVMIPVRQYWWEEKSEGAFFGALGLTVASDGKITELARIAHPGGDRDGDWDWRAMIHRSIVIGDSVYTISNKGIMKSALTDLAEQAFTGF